MRRRGEGQRADFGLRFDLFAHFFEQLTRVCGSTAAPGPGGCIALLRCDSRAEPDLADDGAVRSIGGLNGGCGRVLRWIEVYCEADFALAGVLATGDNQLARISGD